MSWTDSNYELDDADCHRRCADEEELRTHKHGCYCGEGYALCTQANCTGAELLSAPCCDALLQQVREEVEAIELEERNALERKRAVND